jgi:hypothetical protein
MFIHTLVDAFLKQNIILPLTLPFYRLPELVS